MGLACGAKESTLIGLSTSGGPAKCEVFVAGMKLQHLRK